MTQDTLERPPEAPFAPIDEKAERLCKMLATAMGENDEAVFDYDYEGRVEEIESQSRDGFWAWTSGGYHVCLPAALSHHWGTGAAPAPIEPIIESGNELIADEWARQYPERPSLVDCICANAGTPDEAQWQEEAQDFEMEGWQSDDACYFWKARVMFLEPSDPGYRDEEAPDPGEPYVYIDAYLNTDLNYGRDHIAWLSAYGSSPNQTCGEFRRVFSLPEFRKLTDQDLERIVAEAVESLP